MGFADLGSDAGLAMLNSWVTTRSYISGYVPHPLFSSPRTLYDEMYLVRVDEAA